ncbi:hypothetical protein [Qipengyuania sediminis]|uniref:hypothetical protein n=1 Tax=Qipengyuania sediminis TaxID=1532023 RepID=UPI001059DE65|nr:hypothetical protein [Qipengyuania sediminis]
MSVTQTIEPVAMKRTLPTDGAGNSQASEWLNGAQIDYANFGTDPALKEGSETLAYGGDMVAQIDNLRANPHPEDNAAMHARKVREAVDALDNSWAIKADSARASLKARLRTGEVDLAKAANLNPVDKFTNAILGTFAGLNPGERAKALSDLVEASDGPTLAALLAAPSLVTNITQEQRDTLKLQLFLKVNPSGVALRDQLTKALDKMERASIASIRARAALRDGTDRFTARAKAAEALANKARTGFGA